MPERKLKIKVNLYLEPELHETIQRTADDSNRSLTGQIEYELKQLYLDLTVRNRASL